MELQLKDRFTIRLMGLEEAIEKGDEEEIRDCINQLYKLTTEIKWED